MDLENKLKRNTKTCLLKCTWELEGEQVYDK
jgi:hypothetical protein